MTWESIRESGSGDLEFRITIEGCHFQFVTNAAMAQTLSDGRERVVGLMREGISIEDSVDPARATLEARGMSIQIMDDVIDTKITKAFAQIPSADTFVAADCLRIASFLAVSDSSRFQVGDVIHVGTEAMLVGTVSAGLLGNLTRGYWDTVPQKHVVSRDLLNPPQKVYRDRPASLDGRRVQLHVYGTGDDPQGDGTLVWRGVCLTEARLDDDGSIWSLEIGGLTELFNQDLGTDLDEPFGMRGIYYTVGAPLVLTVASSTTDQIYDKAITGFWETQEEFAASIHSELQTALASHPSFAGLTARVSGNSETWWVDAAWNTTAKVNRVFFSFGSVLDRDLTGDANAIGPEIVRISYPFDTIRLTYRFNVDAVVVGASYRMGGGMGVPRGSFGRHPGENAWMPSERRWIVRPRLTLENDPGTIYLDRDYVSAGEVSFEMKFDDDADPKTITAVRLQGVANEGHRLGGSTLGLRVWGPSNSPEVKPKRNYARGGLKDFRDALTAESPDSASTGAMPLITDDDLAPWSAAPRAERGFSFLTDRSYVATEAVKLGELLREEMKARSLYPGISAVTGRITLHQLKMPTVTQAVAASIDESYQIEGSRATWERGALGSINTAILRTGYDSDQDEYTGRTYVARDIEAYATKKAPRTLSIEMRSEYAQTRGQKLEHIGQRDFIDLLLPVLGVFGRAYSVISVDVDLRLFGLAIGDVVDVTSSHFPNTATGERGATYRGIVIGRAWEFAEGRGTIRILAFTSHELFGYAPTLTVTAQVNTGGNTWDIAYSELDPYGVETFFQSGQSAEDHFAVGGLVRFVQWDDSTPQIRNGVIDVLNTNTNFMTVTFTAAWAPSSFTWIIEPREAAAYTEPVPYNYISDATTLDAGWLDRVSAYLR